MANPILKFKTWILTVTGLIFGENVTFEKKIIVQSLAPGKIPYHKTDVDGLEDSGLYWDGSFLGIDSTAATSAKGGEKFKVSRDASGAGATEAVRVQLFQNASSRGSIVNLVSGVISGTNPYFAIEARNTSSGSVVEVLRCDGAQNVFIGVTTGNEKLTLAGTFSATGYVKNGSYTTTGRDALTPSAGMVIFNTTLVKFQGYNGAAWNNLD